MCTTFAISSIGGFDSKLRRVEDVDLAIRMLFNNVVLTSIPNILVYQNSTSGLHKSAYNNFISEMIVVKKNRRYLISKQLFLYCKLWTRLAIIFLRYLCNIHFDLSFYIHAELSIISGSLHLHGIFMSKKFLANN